MIKTVGIVILLLLAACGSSTSQTLKVNVRDEPHSLDPRKARGLESQTVTKMFFDGLIRIDPRERPELAIANEVLVSDDLKIYTFRLREAKWSNGDAVSAEDFAYAWKKVLEPGFPADQAFQLYVIKGGKLAKEGKIPLDEVGIRVVNAHTLEVELDNPIPYFLELLSLPVFFPVNAKLDLSNPDWAQDAREYVSNGPFLLKEWKHADRIEAQKNSHYWDAANVKLDSMEIVMVSEDTELKMFEKKELDWAGSPLSILPLDALPELKERSLLQQKPFLATYFFRINTEVAPFNHSLMRKAFALAVNRKEIVEHVTQGGQMPATGLVPVSMDLSEDPYFVDGDIEKAKELFQMAKTELKLEELPEVSLMYISNERNHLIAQAVQEEWHKCFGIRVRLEGIERKVFFDRISRGDYQLASGSWTADFSDPLSFLEVFKFKSNGTNNTGWENERYIELLDCSKRVIDPMERKSILKECEAILIDAMPIIPVFHYTMLYVKNNRVHDVVVSGMGSIDFKWSYLAEGEK